MSARAYDHAMSQTFVRRVVTGIDEHGRHVFTDDGAAPNTIVTNTVAVSEVLWVNGAMPSIHDSPDNLDSGFSLEPPPGGASARIIRMPGIPAGADPDSTWLRVAGDDEHIPGMHATDTLDLMIVLEGSVVMGLEDGERIVGPGEVVIQRGTLHRWRPADEHGWTYFVAMLRPDVELSSELTNIKPARVGEHPIRRIVTGDSVIDGGAADAVSSPTTKMTDLGTPAVRFFLLNRVATRTDRGHSFRQPAVCGFDSSNSHLVHHLSRAGTSHQPSTLMSCCAVEYSLSFPRACKPNWGQEMS